MRTHQTSCKHKDMRQQHCVTSPHLSVSLVFVSIRFKQGLQSAPLMAANRPVQGPQGTHRTDSKTMCFGRPGLRQPRAEAGPSVRVEDGPVSETAVVAVCSWCWRELEETTLSVRR